ncbi:hypothetical protein NG754_09645 [Aliarcobacter cryaerophilus]|uniref:hypothetical protein n=1 Tax=Aliarcobacter cryaerophilus TaxID=28198 RepID=UPI003DA632F9
MGVRISGKRQEEIAYDDFISKVISTFNSENLMYRFNFGYVKRFDLNNEFVYLWQDSKGNVCYSFNLLEKGYFTTTVTKLSNALSSHFQTNIEVVNNINETFSKKHSAATNASRASQEAQRFTQNLNSTDNRNNLLSHAPQSHYEHRLHQDRVALSHNQYKYTNQTHYLHLSELPIIYKEQFSPYDKLFFYRQNALVYKNSYTPSEYMIYYVNTLDVENSFILSFLFAMANNDVKKAMSIIVWLAKSFNLLQKLPYALVLHSKDDIPMRLFYEEIIEPLFNKNYCEIISNDTLDKKALSQKLDEKVIYRFHNTTTPTILEEDAKELVKRLIHKEEYRLNNKHITTLANILITSTSKYIPLIAKDVPCIVVDTASNLEEFCKEKKISTDYYAIATLIKNDLMNFASILRYIDLNSLSTIVELQYYNGDENRDIIDGDVAVVKVFESAIKNKDEAFFQKIKLQAPKLYSKLSDDFSKNRIDRKNLIEYFSILFGEDIFKTNRALVAKLKEISTTVEPFENEDTFNNNGRIYYKIK